MCSFFSNMRIQPRTGIKYKLLAFCCSSIYFLNGIKMRTSSAWKAVDHDIFLAVVPEIDGMASHEYDVSWLFDDVRRIGAIHPLLSSELGKSSKLILQPRKLDARGDISRMSQWLSYCAEHHGDRCAAPKGRDGALREFRVINCTMNSLSLEIHPFTIKYVALSYVWGSGPPGTLPEVVVDAVELTRKLGLQYLWVDRLCIDQSNLIEKHYLISKMAWIYECAEFTIVAAAGSDATYGLPGVCSVRREFMQPEIHVSPGLTLISSMGDPRIAIKESVWSTRGWTYQESVLSNRRLVFTDEQVYFECRGMAVWESIELPLDLYHNESASMMDSYVRSGVFRGSGEPQFSSPSSVWGFGNELSNPDPVYESALRIDEHIYAFSQRVLTYDGDSLLAFSGVVESLASGEGLRMILGIPVWAATRARKSLLLSFGLSLSCWAHTETGSSESEFCRVRRRRHLPSWTWAGWAGTITWRAGHVVHSEIFAVLIKALETAERGTNLAYTPEIALQDSSKNSIVRLSEVDSLKGLADNRLHRLLVREPFILDVNLTAFDPKNQQWTYRDSHIEVKLSINMTTADVWKGHESGELNSLLTFFGGFKMYTVAQFLVLEKAPWGPDRQHWERVGTLDLFPMLIDVKDRPLATDAIQKLPVKRWVDEASIG
jgi:hypothetical protein